MNESNRSHQDVSSTNQGLVVSGVQQDSDCLNGSDVIQETSQGIANESNQDLESSSAHEISLIDDMAESSTLNEIEQEISDINQQENNLDTTLTDEQSLEEENEDDTVIEEVIETEAASSALSESKETHVSPKIEDSSHQDIGTQKKANESEASQTEDVHDDPKETDDEQAAEIASNQKLNTAAGVSSAETKSRRTYSQQDVKGAVAATVYHDPTANVTRDRTLSDLRCTIFPWMNPGIVNLHSFIQIFLSYLYSRL